MPENLRTWAASLPALSLCEKVDEIATEMARSGSERSAVLLHEAVLRLTETAAPADNATAIQPSGNPRPTVCNCGTPRRNAFVRDVCDRYRRPIPHRS